MTLTALQSAVRYCDKKAIKYFPFDIKRVDDRVSRMDMVLFRYGGYGDPPMADLQILRDFRGERWYNLCIDIKPLGFKFEPDKKTIFTPEIIEKQLLPIYKYAAGEGTYTKRIYEFMTALVENNCMLYPR